MFNIIQRILSFLLPTNFLIFLWFSWPLSRSIFPQVLGSRILYFFLPDKPFLFFLYFSLFRIEEVVTRIILRIHYFFQQVFLFFSKLVYYLLFAFLFIKWFLWLFYHCFPFHFSSSLFSIHSFCFEFLGAALTWIFLLLGLWWDHFSLVGDAECLR